MKTTKTKITNDEMLEGFDKFTFLRWLQDECVLSGLSDEEINHICTRWIKRREQQMVADVKRRIA